MNYLLVDEILQRALIEDLGHGDITTELLPDPHAPVAGELLAKADGVLCGAEIAARCFELVDPACTVSLKLIDGDPLGTGDSIGMVKGPATAVLSAERVALNFLQRLSGIASFARMLAQRAAPLGIRIVETRKTTPGLRTLEKYAVQTGAGFNHRMDLDSCVMLKDNHFAIAAYDPAELVRSVREKASHTLKIIAEAGDATMIEPLIAGGADVILLDNFAPDEIEEAVRQINGRTTIEVSGGINSENLEGYLITGVDVISIGALTHSYKALDISLEVKHAAGL